MKKLTILLALCLAGTPLSAFAQTRTFSVSSEEVRVDVRVTVDGKITTDLKESDFEVYDNGVRQEIAYVKLQQHMPIDATLVFDLSRSVNGELLDNLKNAAAKLLDDFGERDRAGLITFNHEIHLGSPITGDLARIREALDQKRPFGNSSLIDAGYSGLMLAESGSELPLIIIFSDGLDTSSWLTADSVLATAKRIDSVVYAISSRRRPEKTFLADLTKLTGGNLYEVEFNDDLAIVFLSALEEFRSRYLIAYTPRGVPDNGWHELEVRVNHRSAKIHTRPGYDRSDKQKFPEVK